MLPSNIHDVIGHKKAVFMSRAHEQVRANRTVASTRCGLSNSINTVLEPFPRTYSSATINRNNILYYDTSNLRVVFHHCRRARHPAEGFPYPHLHAADLRRHIVTKHAVIYAKPMSVPLSGSTLEKTNVQFIDNPIDVACSMVIRA